MRGGRVADVKAFVQRLLISIRIGIGIGLVGVVLSLGS